MSTLPRPRSDHAHRRRRIAFVAVATAAHLAAVAALSALPPRPGVPAGTGGHVITAEAIVEEAAAAPGPEAAAPVPPAETAEASTKQPETAEPPPTSEPIAPPPEPAPIEATEPAPKKPAEVMPPKPEPRRPVEPRPRKPKKPREPAVAATRPPRVERAEAPPSAVATGSAGTSEGKAANGRGRTEAAAAPSGSVLAAYAALVASEIERHKYYPPAAREAGLSGTVSVAFTIGPSGTVVSHAVTRSSGAPALDAVVPSMMAATRVPPPPGGRFRGTIAVRFSVGR